MRLAIIGVVLGCIPRASTLSCFFLVWLILIADWTIDARQTASGWHVLAAGSTYVLVLQDGIIMTAMLVAVHIVRMLRTSSSKLG